MPAAAVIREGQALLVVTGRKGYVGGLLSSKSNLFILVCLWLLILVNLSYIGDSRTSTVEMKCVNSRGNNEGEDEYLGITDAEVRRHGYRTGLETLVVYAVNDED